MLHVTNCFVTSHVTNQKLTHIKHIHTSFCSSVMMRATIAAVLVIIHIIMIHIWTI